MRRCVLVKDTWRMFLVEAKQLTRCGGLGPACWKGCNQNPRKLAYCLERVAMVLLENAKFLV